MLIPLREARKITGLSANTLRKYADTGKVKSVRLTENGQRLYDTNSLQGIEQEQRSSIVCYCRVSSRKQKDDLVRQVCSMREQFPNAEIIQDIGSSLDFKRKGLQSVLGRLLQGDRFTLVVAHADRLCRFGFDIFEYLFEQNGGELLVLDRDEVSPERELTEDLLAILHVFSCRMHGLRRYTRQIEEDKNLSYATAEESV